MLKTAAAALLLVLLAGCNDYGDCLQSHAQIVFQYFPMGQGGAFMMIPEPTTVCDQWQYPAGNGPKAS